MKCPKCGDEARATETRKTNGVGVRRRRRCMSLACDFRFTTMEVMVTASTNHRDAVIIVLPAHVARELRGALSVLNHYVGDDGEAEPHIGEKNGTSQA